MTKDLRNLLTLVGSIAEPTDQKFRLYLNQVSDADRPRATPASTAVRMIHEAGKLYDENRPEGDSRETASLKWGVYPSDKACLSYARKKDAFAIASNGSFKVAVTLERGILIITSPIAGGGRIIYNAADITILDLLDVDPGAWGWLCSNIGLLLALRAAAVTIDSSVSLSVVHIGEVVELERERRKQLALKKREEREKIAA